MKTSARGSKQGIPLAEEVRLLSMLDILEPLSEEELKEFARRASNIHLKQDEVFHAPGDYGERLFLLKRGRVQVYQTDPAGNEHTLSISGGGAMLGEMVLAGQRLEGVYARALLPSAICALGREELGHLIRTNSEVGLRIVQSLSEQLLSCEARLAEFAHKEVPARLAGQILRLVQSEGVVTREGYKIQTPYTHEQLAAMIGSKRVPVTRAFRKLREAGAVKSKDRRILVVDYEALQRLAEGNARK